MFPSLRTLHGVVLRPAILTCIQEMLDFGNRISHPLSDKNAVLFAGGIH